MFRTHISIKTLSISFINTSFIKNQYNRYSNIFFHFIYSVNIIDIRLLLVIVMKFIEKWLFIGFYIQLESMNLLKSICES